MDAENGLCLGCFRTIDEITVWSRTDDTTRAKILAAITERQQADALEEDKLRVNAPR